MAAPVAASERCARQVVETVPLVMRFIRAEMRRAGSSAVLSVPQFRVLIFLRRHPRASLSAVADHLGVTRPTASTLVDRLVRRGLVARATRPEERRQVVLTIKPAGLQLVSRAREATCARLAMVLEALSPKELAQVEGALALLERWFKEAT